MRPLRILCIQLGFHEAYPDVSTLATTYNDGLYYVASFIRRELKGSRVDVCQMFWGEKPTALPLEEYDYILVSALATHFWSNLPVLEELRSRKKKGCRIIMGGPHATFAPYEALRYADFAVLGEGEVPVLQLLQCLENGGALSGVNNLCYLDGNGQLVLTAFKRFPNLNNTIDARLLASAPKLHWATVSMSRGCPYNCSFCYAVRLLGRMYRTKSVEDIVGELDGIATQTGCRRFYVTDLDFTIRKDFCHAVAQALRPKGYSFVAMSRIEFADEVELMDELKASGFGEYCLGVESEDPGVLKSFNKRVNASQQTERLLRFAEHGIYTHSAIIFGLESQDLPRIEQTARWCAESRLMHPTFVCLAEYPFQNMLYGSRQDIEDHRIIMEVPTYQHYSFVGIFPRHLRPSQLQRAILKSYELFFARALELEQQPARRMRLKSYERSVAVGKPGMERHIQFLEELEKPYYTPSGTLREELLKQDFEQKHGAQREWLRANVQRPAEFMKAFSA